MLGSICMSPLRKMEKAYSNCLMHRITADPVADRRQGHYEQDRRQLLPCRADEPNHGGYGISHNVYYVQDRLGIDSATKSGQWHPGHPPVSNPSHSASAPMVACAQGYPATSMRHTSLVRRTSPNQRSNSKGTPSPQPRRIQRQAAPQPP